ncbi:hypothetical protein BDV38DRAFT_252929 [Aspergillus pseudotamarii]|uniref:TIL domain-containing protein n=1 Tax=Aspergillus pseudotamarii TaxID=132259 RepID=A0A5N6SN37_ASPPS|nr:uncharacterized protein BDV38DRAFT_252929 [Aspergillus pseudotamarii]KAE8135279.1 hypothetical protein BDV38DRAFT_252929 [Aspergillus pseudotamarii]
MFIITSTENKMQFKSTVLVFLLAAASAAYAKESCPENQKWNNCGTACPPTCNSQSNEICTMECVPGCQCIDGYVLNADDQCILESEC